MVPVPKNPIVAPQPRFHLPGAPREKLKNAKNKFHDYCYLHAFGDSARTWKLSENKRERSGALASGASGGELAPMAEGPVSAVTESEECEGGPQRFVIAETPTQSQEAEKPKREGVNTHSQSRSPAKKSTATPSKLASK